MIAQFDPLLWSIASRFYETGAYTKEDLFSEARLAALIAIRKFKNEKKARLATFIYRAAMNHLINIYNKEKKRKQVETESSIFCGTSDSAQKEIEFDLTIRSLFTEKERDVFEKLFVEDAPVSHIRGRQIPAKKFDAHYSQIIKKYRREQCGLAHTCR
ncbi:MAG TPA: sigma-70 family RNA polymerase sigma factor [Rhabdochlamydiaceae bacterium]|nr:sigma-70 family RNA polymerase sigma factor [Rhabdochlamydiaceae bacterium]